MLPIFKVVAVAPGERGNVKREFVPPSLLSLDVLVFQSQEPRSRLSLETAEEPRHQTHRGLGEGGTKSASPPEVKGESRSEINSDAFVRHAAERADGRQRVRHSSPLPGPSAGRGRSPARARPRPPAPALTCPVAYQMRNAVRRPKTVITVFGEDRLSMQRC